MKKQRAGLKSFDLPFFPGVEAISGQHIANEFRRHIHKTYIIGIVEQGKRIITHREGTSQISENEIFILNPGQVHSCSSECPSGHSYKLLSVSSQTMQSITSHISERHEKAPCFREIRYASDALSDKFLKIVDLMEELESEIDVESSIYSFLSHLLINFAESPPLIHETGEQKSSIKRTCDYISRHFMENLTLKKLAGIACLSPFHYQREFKKIMGLTPHEYLSDFRIGESKKMLLRSEEIADIAIQVGFFDQSHFSRTFRKTMGIPPGRYCRINKHNNKSPFSFR